jgi:hypothetical protein
MSSSELGTSRNQLRFSSKLKDDHQMNDRDESQERANSAQKVHLARRAIEAGSIKVLPEHARLVDELMGPPVGPIGLIDTSVLSKEALAFARATGMAARFIEQREPLEHVMEGSVQEGQSELFRHFTYLFVALTGVAPETHLTREQVKDLMLALVSGKNADQWARQVNTALDELRDFYNKHRLALYQQAKKLGGVKFVVGGQRAFEFSALQGIRISGLYADTQLIPDPIYPHLTADLQLNAQQLQLTFSLYYLLKLKPLVDAQLPVPAVFVFPSFEQELQERDSVTMTGLNDLMVRVVGNACQETFTRAEEVFEFAAKHEDQFVDAIARAHLFVPPGADPAKQMSPRDSARRYLMELEGVRDQGTLEDMKRLPLGVLLLNGIMERLQPQYHLFENSEDLDAQPLLTQAVHWYYFEKCADATATALVRKTVLSEQGFASLRALHDHSLTWLANIPVEGLVDLHRNLEHQAFREELKKYTAQLAAAGPVELDSAVREVHTGLAYLLSKQEKALRDIEDRYSPKKWGLFVGGTLGVVAAASTVFIPSLAPLLGAALPAAAISGAAVGTAIGTAKEKMGELVEKRRASKSLLGMLAVARNAK